MSSTQEDQRAVGVSLVHLGQEAEPDQRRRGEAEDERPWARIAQDQRRATTSDSRPVRTKPMWRRVIGPRTATLSRDERRPPRRSWTSHQMFQACRDRIGEDRRSGSRPGCAGSRPARRPAMNGSHRTTMTASPIAAVRAISRQPAVRPEPGRERQDERQRLRLGHQAEREGRRGQPVAAVEREHEGGQGRQQVDALVLAPPGADVDDRRVEQDRSRPRRRPSTAAREARTTTSSGETDVGQRRRAPSSAPGSPDRSCR